MEIVFDHAKSLRNILERQLPFERAIEFEWDTAIYWEDTRFLYPERRIMSLGCLGDRLHALCFAQIEENIIRVISFRKANKRERARYEKARKAERSEEHTSELQSQSN